MGGDYNRHDGPIQNADGTVTDVSRSSAMFGVGSGIGSAAIFSFSEAIFAPLAARQTLRSREADLQASTNDSLVVVTDAFFTVEQARGELAGAIDARRRGEELVRRLTKLAPGIVPALEVTRSEAEVARLQQAESLARERWQVSGAELARVLRLDATAQLDPLELPHLQVSLIDLDQPIDDLVALGLTNRPELSANRAQVQATLVLLKQEKLRPLIPSLLIRGWSTPVTGTLGVGAFAGGTNGSLGSYSIREDVDVQLLWQLDNLGFGNVARTRQRRSEYRAATLQLLRTQDRIASEVVQAHAQARQATRRIELAERGVKLALESFQEALEGLGQTRRVGDLVQTVVRPQEVLAAVQALAQAYGNYYDSIADANRAQFRLYRALGRPAQFLGSSGRISSCSIPTDFHGLQAPAIPLSPR
jgi:outer membrane protein TolC